MAFCNPPSSVTVDGANYPINTDFRTVLLFLEMWEDDEIPTGYKLGLMADMFGVDAPSQVWEWINEGEKVDLEETVKVLDFVEDEKYIYSAFMQEYNIDLYEIKYLHWYKFKWLLNGLSDKCLLKQIMQIRAMDVYKIKDSEERERLKKIQNQYKLRDKQAEMLLGEINESGW